MSRKGQPFSWKETGWKENIREKSPLVHCITNHIAITGSANSILALGARPIMAEHPREMAEVTGAADALVCNLGNISDTRMEAMRQAGDAARERGIFRLLDIVGAGCSSLRLSFARELAERMKPVVIKGNLSEIKAFAGEESHASGVDAGKQDIREEQRKDRTVRARWARSLAERYGCRVVVTGAEDMIADGSQCFFVENGCPRMGQITGTGCMLGGILAAFATVSPPEDLTEALAFAAACYGICGEKALEGTGLGTGYARLFDWLEAIDGKEVSRLAKVIRITGDEEGETDETV